MKHNLRLVVLFGILMMCGTAFTGCVNSGANTTISQNGMGVPTIITGHITAQTGDNVTVVYTGTLDDGTVFDSNANTTPVTFTLGHSTVLPGFEKAVTGMAVGEVKNVTIPFTEAYGPHREELVHLLPRMGPLENKSFTVGTYVRITNRTDNSYSVVKILNVTPDSVTWDENDPLAGQNLTFMIRVTNIERK